MQQRRKNLLIPYALDADGSVVLVDDRVSAGSKQVCPDCGGAVFPKRGGLRRHHFAHKFEGERPCGLGGESGEHIYAKFLVVRVGEKAVRNEKVMPRIRVPGVANGSELTEFDLPKFHAVRLEQAVRCSEAKLRRPDVLFCDEAGIPLFGIEVLHSHAVDAEKVVDLGDFKWIEIEAAEIIRTCEDGHPTLWAAVRQGGFVLAQEKLMTDADAALDFSQIDPGLAWEAAKEVGREFKEFVVDMWRDIPQPVKIGLGTFAGLLVLAAATSAAEDR